ncbi:MAG: hypothetical protein ACT4O5_04155 [Gammaproteobacteria bacterium]
MQEHNPTDTSLNLAVTRLNAAHSLLDVARFETDAETVARSVDLARAAYDEVRSVLTPLELDVRQRKRLTTSLDALSARLEAVRRNL